jgi:hypothetical protein
MDSHELQDAEASNNLKRKGRINWKYTEPWVNYCKFLFVCFLQGFSFNLHFIITMELKSLSRSVQRLRQHVRSIPSSYETADPMIPRFITYFPWYQCDNTHVINFCYHIVYSYATPSKSIKTGMGW